MIRRFNYTGRKPLPPDRVTLAVKEGQPRTFSAGFKLEGLELPPDASIYVEATSKGALSVMRFPFGTVANPKAPPSTTLHEVEGERVIFNVKVVDEKHENGRILAVAQDIARGGGEGEDEAASHPLLPVNPIDLGDEVWRVNFRTPDGRPYLDVNKNIEGIKTLVRSDKRFFSLVFPSVIRTVLRRILIDLDFNDPVGEGDGSGELDWQARWLRWGAVWHPDNKENPRGGAENEADAIEDWIDEVAREFCRRHSVREQFLTSLGEEQ